MVPQLVENLLHLKRSQNVLNQNGGFDRALRDAEQIFGFNKHVVPEARFQIMLELGQIEINARALFEAIADVVEEIDREIKQAAGSLFPINPNMFFGEVPAARAHQQRSGLVV